MSFEEPTIRSALKGEITCAVCQEILNRPQALLPCLHTFCLDCVNYIPSNNYEGRITCPVCRGRSTGHVPNFSIQSIIDIFNNASLKEEEETVDEDGETDVESTRIIERVQILSDSHSVPSPSNVGESSSSNSQPVRSEDHVTVAPCRSCREGNDTNYQCLIPIREDSPETYGHVLCECCLEYMPARGKDGTEPAFDQCCSFCGIIYCDAYWTCSNRSSVAKLRKLSDVTNIRSWVASIERIDSKEEGYLNMIEIGELEQHLRQTSTTWDEAWQICLFDINENHFRTPFLTRMTPTAHEVYNTHRVPKYYDILDEQQSENEEDEEREDYFDQIGQMGTMPSHLLRACSFCLPAIVNGQLYGYWRSAIETGMVEHTKELCSDGMKCEIQWTSSNHATRLSHVEA